MSDTVILPPTAEILRLCDDADLLVERYLACLRTIRTPIGRFEAEVEAYTMLKLLIRHLESICLLARNDLIALPSAMVLARASFEASLRAKWMLQPVDPYEREVRWILHLRSSSEHCGKLERSSHTPPRSAQAYGRSRASVEKFDAELCRLLNERGYVVPKQAPNIWEMLKQLDQPQLYQFYVLLSAFTHANFEAGTLYRKHLGNSKELGEFITPANWHLPLQVAWKSVFVVARDYLFWVEADLSCFKPDDLAREFEIHLQRLEPLED